MTDKLYSEEAEKGLIGAVLIDPNEHDWELLNEQRKELGGRGGSPDDEGCGGCVVGVDKDS